jgi:hypothetical protein
LVRSLARSLAKSSLSSSLVIQEGGAAVISEYITDGGFDGIVAWVNDPGTWSLEDSMAVCNGGAGTLVQDFGALVAPLTNGSDYTLTFDATNPDGALIRATLTGGTGSQIIYSSTTNGAGRTATFTASDARTTISFVSFNSEAFSMDNVSLTPA